MAAQMQAKPDLVVGGEEARVQKQRPAKRLLALNHQRAAEEQAKVPAKSEKAGKGKVAKGKNVATDHPGLFG